MSLFSLPACDHRLVSLIVMTSSLSAQQRPTKSSHSVIACNYSPHVATVCTLWKDGQSELEKHVWTQVNSKMCAQFKRQENVQNAQSFLFLSFSCCVALCDLLACSSSSGSCPSPVWVYIFVFSI